MAARRRDRLLPGAAARPAVARRGPPLSRPHRRPRRPQEAACAVDAAAGALRRRRVGRRPLARVPDHERLARAARSRRPGTAAPTRARCGARGRLAGRAERLCLHLRRVAAARARPRRRDGSGAGAPPRPGRPLDRGGGVVARRPRGGERVLRHRGVRRHRREDHAAAAAPARSEGISDRRLRAAAGRGRRAGDRVGRASRGRGRPFPAPPSSSATSPSAAASAGRSSRAPSVRVLSTTRAGRSRRHAGCYRPNHPGDTGRHGPGEIPGPRGLSSSRGAAGTRGGAGRARRGARRGGAWRGPRRRRAR